MKKAILLTGATGFIGKQVLKYLLSQNHHIIAPTRNPSKLKSFQNHRNLEIIKHNIYTQDLNVKCDILVHLAWSGMDNVRDFSHIETNFMRSLAFLKNALKCGVRQIAVAGSCFEYGTHWGKVSEHFIPNPQTSYGIAKVFLQKALCELQKTYDFRLKWLRIFYLYGEGQNPHSLIPQLQSAINAGQMSFDMSGGEQMRDYLDIQIAAKYIANIALNDAFDGVCNICSGAPISIRNLLERYLRDTNQKIHLNFGFYPYPNYEPLAYFGDDKLLNELLQNPNWGGGRKG
ncbi:NAD-dependent epimerase/dehydratase family protein [Helicobacter sp. 23-1045]